MAKEKSKEQYQDVVDRLKEIVGSLESQGLSLEDSLEKFAEGVQLVKKGEKLLTDAEKRIEQLLSQNGEVAPLDVSVGVTEATPPVAKKKAPIDNDDDIPF